MYEELRIYVNQVPFLAVNMLKCNKFYSIKESYNSCSWTVAVNLKAVFSAKHSQFYSMKLFWRYISRYSSNSQSESRDDYERYENTLAKSFLFMKDSN